MLVGVWSLRGILRRFMLSNGDDLPTITQNSVPGQDGSRSRPGGDGNWDQNP